jgi:ring-1,2-phenylacetyl-CoA epoxidase subunit PaaD
MITEAEVYAYLENVHDPEVPVLNVLDLGIVRSISIEDGEVKIAITPTYSGCPAMHTIATNIKFEMISRGITQVTVSEVLHPAWTTDWMSDAGKQKLKEYGIAPPQYTTKENPFNTKNVPCPICDSEDTTVLSLFASTSCKAMYKCNSCLEAFDYFKCH